MQVSDYILNCIQSYGATTAQVDAETHRRISFDDIKCKCAKLAKWFRSHNLGKGSTVGLMSSNNIDFIWILLGVWTSGAACRLICPKSTLYELIHALDITPVECLLMQKGKLKRLACPKISAVKYVLEFGEEKTHCSDGAITLEDALKDLKEDDHFDQSLQVKPTVQNETQNVAARDKSSNIPDDIALILTSSGTTGLPKCVMLTHGNIITALKKRHLFVEKSAVALGLMPFRHAYGLITMVMCLCEGAVLVNMTSFSFLRWINIIKEFSVSHLHIVPSLSLSLLKSDIVNFEDLRSVRQIWVAAAPICEEAHEKLKKKFHQPVRIYKAYGLTEATFIVAFGEFERQKPGCIGKIVETMQCKIIDKDSGDDLPINKVGEVCFKGPMVAKGYVNDPEATAEIFCSGGWVRSGDLGSLDEAGCFYYVDRMKNIIKYQGQQISPCELETVLISHPDVKEAAVIGVPHEIFGEVPRAFIVPLDHSKVIAQDIHDYMKEMVAPFKQLIGGIVFLTELPKTGLGKVKRSTLLNFEPKTVFYDEIRGKISVHSHTLESGENRTEAVTTK
ncbi:unnamed protein product [Bemisia tabaci]|uniref:Uncharacterized protein n=1 Tax=Bemisia tabaci TaxID=7038 RepID=A0A9P0A8L9_BEMTA|nr:unnamed protein product [Bemisia tabaci]